MNHYRVNQNFQIKKIEMICYILKMSCHFLEEEKKKDKKLFYRVLTE